MACEYALVEPDGWVALVAAFEQDLVDEGGTVVLHGKCSRCDHDMSVDLPIERRTRRKVSDVPDKQPLAEDKFVKVAFCNCGFKHTDRPEDRYGCGAYGALVVGEGAD